MQIENSICVAWLLKDEDGRTIQFSIRQSKVHLHLLTCNWVKWLQCRRKDPDLGLFINHIGWPSLTWARGVLLTPQSIVLQQPKIPTSDFFITVNACWGYYLHSFVGREGVYNCLVVNRPRPILHMNCHMWWISSQDYSPHRCACFRLGFWVRLPCLSPYCSKLIVALCGRPIL